jgi:hypothetical protein
VTSATAGNDHPYVHILAKPVTKRLQMGLHSAHLGRVELADMQDSRSAPRRLRTALELVAQWINIPWYTFTIFRACSAQVKRAEWQTPR